MTRFATFPRLAFVGLLPAVFMAGCGTPIKPEELRTPVQPTCIRLTEPVEYTGSYGAFDVRWTTRLERGPYVSEKMDEKGTFFRAPPGGVSIINKDGAGIPGQGPTADGGFYVPNNPTEPITIYKYFSVATAPTQVPEADVDCSTVGYLKEPSTAKISFVSVAVGGAAGGATAGLIGKSMVPASKMSYGQAAGAGAAGGLIGGLIIGAMINADVGKIVPGLPINDSKFNDTLRTLFARRVSLVELRPAAVGETAPGAAHAK